MPIDIFFSYAHEDEDLMNLVRRQLVVFERQGKIVKWHDRQIPAGMEWQPTIDQRLQQSRVILLFVSPAFLESRYCWDVEVKVALERHERGEARVIPIILRPCPWEAAPFSKLQALPADAKPLTAFADRDQASLDIARAIITVVDELMAAVSVGTTGIDASEIVRRGVYRRKMEGDRIPRLIADFTPPTGINIPPGYQRRLNQISAEVVRDSAVRSEDGRFQYPAQFKGALPAIRIFTDKLHRLGKLQHLGTQDGLGEGEIWFEYAGDTPPDKVTDLALQCGLALVHCGATLLLHPK